MTALADLIPPNTEVERIAGGFAFTEGPVWCGDHLLFSDIRKDRIVRWRELPEGPEVTTFATGESNGLTLDRQSRVLAAEHGGRRVSRIAPDGARTVLAERYQGKRLNSPNDIVVKSDGAIYFTDPPYALVTDRVPNWWTHMLPGKELSVNGVFRLDVEQAPSPAALTLLVDDFALPNGLAFSPDERTLYVNDSERKHIRAFDVQSDGMLSNSRVLIQMDAPEPGVPDGMKVDAMGNVFCTGPGGVWVCSPAGERLGVIQVPEIPANVAWGGAGWSTLFITARTSVYRLQTKTRGVPVGGAHL